MITPLERLRSIRHRFWFGVSERVRWTRGVFQERPAGDAWRAAPAHAHRVAQLQARYAVHFEDVLGATTCANNYEYLDILDVAWVNLNLPRLQGGMLCDVGCASFWYAAALHSFFKPQRMTGIDIEGHRLFRDGRSRVDYAHGYARTLPGTRFVVADYTRFEQPADLITAWFPFLTATAVLAWRLPLSVLNPQRLFAQVQHNLKAGGHFIMVNHGLTEAALAEHWCSATGLRLVGRWAEAGSLSDHRHRPPVVSCWQQS